MGRKDILGIQYLRAYAAILVVFNHLWPSNSIIYERNNFGSALGSFGVDIFFIITGFIMAYTLGEFKAYENITTANSFLRKRVARIYPLHFIMLIPAIVIYMHRCNLSGDSPSWKLIIGSFLLFPDITSSTHYKMINHVEWSLVYEMLFYILIFFCILLTKSKGKALAGCSIFIGLMVFLVNFFDVRGPQLGWVNLSYISGDYLSFTFIFGFLLYYTSKKITIRISKLMSLLLLISSTLISVILLKYGVSKVISQEIPALVIVAVFIMGDGVNEGKIKSIYLLGASSYAMYLIHPILESHEFLLGKKISSEINVEIMGFLLITTAIALGIAAHLIVEKRMNRVIAKMKS